MKTFFKSVKAIAARPRNKRLRDCQGGGSSGRGSSAIGGGGSTVVEGHTHENMEDLDKLSVVGQELKINGTHATVNQARIAEHAYEADVAKNFSPSLWQRVFGIFLRKDTDDETTHKITVGSLKSNKDVTINGNLFANNCIYATGEVEVDGTLAVHEEANFDQDIILPGTGFTKNATGGKIWADEHNFTHEQVDFLRVNQKLSVDTLEINHTEHIGGKLVISAAHCTASKVLYDDDTPEDSTSFGIYFKAKDADGNKIYNTWKVGDLAYCKTYDVQVGSRFWWREVTKVSTSPTSDGYHWIEVSNNLEYGQIGYHEDSDFPEVGDYIVQLGSLVHGRQGALVLCAGEGGSPYFRVYKGINTFSMPQPIKDDSPDGLSATYKSLKVIVNGEEKNVSNIIADAEGIHLFVEGFKNSLLATGIDIDNEKILITGDNFGIRNNQGEDTFKVDEYGNVAIYGAVNSQVLDINSQNFDKFFSEDPLTGNHRPNILNMGNVIWLSDELQDELFTTGSFSIELPAIVERTPEWYYDYGEQTDEERCANIRKLLGRKIYIYNYLGGTLHINCHGIDGFEVPYVINGTQLQYNCNPHLMTLLLPSCRCACLELKMRRHSWASGDTYETLYWDCYAGGQFD